MEFIVKRTDLTSARACGAGLRAFDRRAAEQGHPGHVVYTPEILASLPAPFRKFLERFIPRELRRPKRARRARAEEPREVAARVGDVSVWFDAELTEKEHEKLAALVGAGKLKDGDKLTRAELGKMRKPSAPKVKPAPEPPAPAADAAPAQPSPQPAPSTEREPDAGPDVEGVPA